MEPTQAERVAYWTTGYNYWTAALAGKPAQLFGDSPCAGFYRKPIMERDAKSGNNRRVGWTPVAVFMRDGALTARVGSETMTGDILVDLWSWVAKYPVSEEWYRLVAEKGGEWPDAKTRQDTQSVGPVAVLHTNPIPAGAVTPVDVERQIEELTGERTSPEEQERRRQAAVREEIKEQIAVAGAGVPAYAKIESDEASTRATGLRNMLMDLAGTADKTREALKAPHLKAEREIDAEWQPIIKQAREFARQIKDARDSWEDTKRAAALEAQRRAQDEQRVRDEENAKNDIRDEPPPPVEARSNLPPPSAQIKPTYGKAAHVGTKMVVTAVDWDKMIQALKPRPEWPTLQAFLQEMAQKLANHGVILDGVTAVEKANTK